MKIVFVAGFLNNHVLPICEEFLRYNEFTFISTQDWKDGKNENKAPLEREFVLHDFVREERPLCIQIVKEADIAIFGGNSDFYLNIRKKLKKLSYIYCENLFKRGRYRIVYPPLLIYLYKKFCTKNENLKVLCASSHLPEDLMLLRFPRQQCFKFGYFPKIQKNDLTYLLRSKSITNGGILKLLYVGRLLKWKCVNNVIECAHLLKQNGIKFELNIIGDGPEKQFLEYLKDKYNLEETIFHGLLPNNVVADFMRMSDILYLSSNKYEGWGAVVNEALGNACVVIASSFCGSTNYLINDNENGYITQTNSPKALYDKTLKYFNQKNKRALHINAYNSIWDLWNEKTATQRLIEISKGILNNYSVKILNGPLSQG